MDYIDLTTDDAVSCHRCGHSMALMDDTCRACGAQHIDTQPASPARLPASPMASAYPLRRVYKSPTAACLLNLLLLGAGYFYLGQVGKGLLVLFIGIIAGALTSWIATVVVLIYAMVNCYNTAQEMNRV